MRRFAYALFAAVAAGFLVSAWCAQPLLEPAQLKAIIHNPDVRVIDIRAADAYVNGHISGAVSAPYKQWRGPPDNPGKLPSKAQLTQLVRSLGLTAGTHAVVVDDGYTSPDFGAMAWVYWTLQYVGIKDVSILNGGLKAWMKADYPQRLRPPEITPSHYQVKFDKSMIATTEEVAAQIGNPHTRLIDARPHKQFLGQAKDPDAAVAGTIKGAINLEEVKWFPHAGSSVFVSKQKARKVAALELTHPATETIAFCNTGQLSATDWFALSQVLGIQNVRLYPQSLVAWTHHEPALPMQNVPSRASQIMKKFKALF